MSTNSIWRKALMQNGSNQQSATAVPQTISSPSGSVWKRALASGDAHSGAQTTSTTTKATVLSDLSKPKITARIQEIDQELASYGFGTNFIGPQPANYGIKTLEERASNGAFSNIASPKAQGLLDEREGLYKTLGKQNATLLSTNSTDVTPAAIQARQNAYQYNTDRIKTLTERIDALKSSGKIFAGKDVFGNERLAPGTGGAAAMKTYKDLVAERDELEAANRIYGYGQKDIDTKITEYGNKPDFTTVSQNRNYQTATPDTVFGYVWGSDRNGKPVAVTADRLAVTDPLGTYLSASKDDITSAYNFEGPGMNDQAVRSYAEVLRNGDAGNWEQVRDEEKNIYYYLLGTEGKEAAVNFLSGMTTELNRRANAAQQEDLRDASAGELFLHNVASVPAQMVGGVTAFAQDVVSTVKGEDINPYTGGHALQNYAQNVRGATAEDIDTATGNANILGLSVGDIYQAGMSGVDALAGIAVFGSGYSVVAGMGAASSTAKELYEKGASKGQIIAGSLLSGAAEIAFEKFSIDHFLKAKDATGWGKVFYNALTQGVVEFSEEAATEIANTASDILVMGSRSEWAQLLQNYKSAGMTDSQAIAKAMTAIGERVWKSGLSGFISGGFMSGGSSAVSLTMNNAEFNRIGSQVVEQVAGDIGQAAAAVTQMGLKTAPGTDTYAAAKTMEQNLLNGKTPSTTALGRLMAEVQSPEAVKARAIYDKTIASGQAMGVDGEVSSRMAQVAARFGIETEWVSPEALKINKTTAADSSGGQNAFIGYADDGKGIYQSNFPKGTPKLAKAKKILKYIQNVWSKEPIPLRVVENGETRVIYAEFDPTYDETENTPTDASKLMGGNRHGNSSDQRVTLDLADDYYQIASESTYNYSKDEEGKSTLTHDDVSRWHYFINDIYFAEYGSDSYAPYRVTVNVKEKPNGHFVYSFSAEKIRESNTPQTLHAVVNEGENSNANVQLSNTTLSQNSVGVNSQFMQDGAEYAQGRYIPATYTVNEQGERVVKTPARILLNAAYADGNWQKLLNFVIKHELTHSIEGTSAWEAMVRTVQRSMGKDGWNAAVEQVRAERQVAGDAAGVANPEAEVIANWVGDNLYKADFIHTMVQSNTRAAGRLVGILDRVRLALGGEGKNPTAGQIAALERTFLKALESGETRGSTGSGEGQYSLNKDAKSELHKALYDKKYQGEVLLRDETPAILLAQKGVRNLPMAMNSSHIRENVFTESEAKSLGLRVDAHTHYHGLGEDFFLQIIDGLDDVTEAYRGTKYAKDAGRRENYFLLVSKFVDKDGNVINVPVYIEETASCNRVFIDTNKVSTVFGRENFRDYLNRQIQNKNLVRIKNRDNRSSESNALIAKDYRKVISNTTVPQNGTGVNTQSMQNGAEYASEEGHNPSTAVRRSPSPYTGEARDGAGQNSILSPERMAEFEGAAQETETVPAQARAQAVTPFAFGSQVQENGKTVSRANNVDGIVSELGDEEAYRRIYAAAQIDRPTESVEVNGQEMAADDYMAAVYNQLPSDEGSLRQIIRQTEAALRQELQEGYAIGDLDTPTRLKIDLQLFAAKAKLEYVLDKGEDGKKTRRFFENRLKGADANQSHQQELLDYLAGRSETYNPISNEKTLSRAKDKLRDPRYSQAILKRVMRINPNDRFSAVDMAAVQVMINDARNDGDLERYADLVQALSRKGTEAGRAVQILSMQARMTPEGTLRAAQRTLRQAADTVAGKGAGDSLDNLSDAITNAVERAAGEKAKATGVVVKSGVSAINEKSKADTTLAYTLASNLDLLKDMDPVTTLTGTEFNDRSKKVTEQIAEFFRSLGNKVKRNTFGDIELDDYGVRSIVNHKPVNRAKVISVASVPAVIKHGRQIAYSPNWKGRGYESYVFAAPVIVADTTVYVAAVVDKRPNGKFYLSEMVDSDGNYVRIEESPSGNAKSGVTDGAGISDEAGITARPEGLSEGGDLSTTNAEPTPTLDGSIAQPFGNVNPLTEQEMVDQLADGIAKNGDPYITATEIKGILERAVEQAKDMPAHLKKMLQSDRTIADLAERIAVVHRNGHLTAETTRRAFEEALGLPTLSAEEVGQLVDLVEQMNAQEEGSQAHLDAMNAIYDFLGQRLPVTALETWQAWRKLAMLANPKTHIRNGVSNVVNYGLIHQLDNLLTAGMERVFLKNIEERTAYLGWQRTEHGKSIQDAVEKATGEAVVRMKRGGGKYDIAGSTLSAHKRYFGNGKFRWLNTVSDFNSSWLEKGDEWTFRPAFRNALGQIMTARNMTEVTTEVFELAYRQAADVTFRADNVLASAINSVKARFPKFGTAVDIVIPFTKTPANIAVQMAQHSPLGLAKATYDLVQNMRSAKNAKGTAAIINEFAKGITGTALFIIGLLLGNAGLFNTGYGKTEKERAADELAGIQENSFVFGGWSLTLDWLQPAAAPLVVGASIAQRLQEDGLEFGTVFGAVMDGADSLFELTMLQSLYDVFGGYDAGVSGSLVSIAENAVSQSIPTLLGQTARAIDPVQRKTKGDNGFETAVNQVLAKIPGLTYLLDPELDVWGEDVYRTGKADSVGGWLNVLQQFLLPSNIKRATAEDEITKEILRLYDEVGSAALPTALSRDDAKDYGLDYIETNRHLGAAQKVAIEDLMLDEILYTIQVEMENGRKKNISKKYSDMSDDERRRVIGRISRKAKERFTNDEKDDDAYWDEIIRRVQDGT